MNEMSDPQNEAEALELAQSSVAQSATSADSIGRIETSHGNVFITHIDGSKVKGEPGLEIFQGDTIDTDATGSVGIVFADDSTFSLAEKGSMVIDSMIYDPGTQEGNSALSVTEGVFTFLSGSIAKTGIDAMVINTPTATIGIRGTSLGGKVTDGKGSIITLLPESGADKAGGDEGGLKGQQGSDGLGPAGEATISNSVGTQTISQPYQTTQVSSRFSSPTLPVTLPASVVNQAYASAISAAPAPRGASAAPTGSSGGNSGAAAGNTDTGDDDTTGQAAPAEDQSNADINAAAQGAASTAFDNAIAGGASLDDAMAAATDAAVESKVLAVLAGNPNAFGTSASIQSIVGAVVNDAMGGLGSKAGDPLDAGKGNDNAVSTQADGPAGGDVLDAIARPATDDADAAIIDNALGLAGSGLLSLGALLDVVANLNAGDPIGDPLAGSTGGTDDFALITQTFNEFTAGPRAGTTEPLIAPTEATVVATAPAGTPTVTTRLSGTAFHALVNAQNDVLTGGAGNDSITLTGEAEPGDSFDGGGGNDTVTFANGANTMTISDTETIVGGTAVDTLTITGSSAGTITAGAAGDSITVSGTTGVQTIVYNAPSEFGDAINGFTAGASGDVIDFNVALSRGTGANFETLATGGTVGTNTAVVNYTTNITNYTTAADVATAMNTLSGIATDNKMLFAVGDGTNTRLWHWQDGTGGASNGTVDAGELTAVADFSGGLNNDSLTDANFSGFTTPVSRNAITGDGTSSGTVGVSTNSVTLNSFTIEAWVNMASGRTGDSWVFSMEQTNDTRNIDFGVRQDGTIWFRDSLANGDWIDLKSAASAVADSTWTHIAVVVDASASGTAATGGSLYVNGAAITPASNVTSGAGKTDWAAATHTSAVTIGTGAFSNFPTVYFNGSIGEVRLWDTSLSAASIATKDDQALTGADNNLVGYWALSEGSGMTAADTGTGTTNNQSASTNPDLGLTLTSPVWTTSGPTLAGSDPLVFDLDGDGVELLGTDAGVLFDVNGDGVGDSVGWVGTDDALLVSDLNGDGLITGMDEVVSPTFGPSAAAGTSSNSLDALTLLDGNADGVIDAADDIYGMLQLWRDANTDGVTDTGELLSLGELGIESISLAGGGVTFEANGNTIWRSSSFTYTDGSTGQVAEVSLALGGERFVFEGANTTLSLSNFSGQTSFLGAAGDGDKLVLDASALGLTSLVYDEVVWDGTSTTLDLNQTEANVVILTGGAGSADAAAAAGNATASNATILFHDSASGSTLTMMHTDSLATDGGETTLATFDGVTDTSAAETLASVDFDLQA